MSDANGIHAAYERLLASREVRRLAARFALDRGVRYEFVDERRSFHGKAGIVDGEGMVRLPCNDRPEAYLLLTLLHEWAHLLAQRQAKGRRILPHGRDWKRYYASLLHAAVGARLFPGNEGEVLRHAAAGEAQTRHCRLLGPDGELLVPAAVRPADEARFSAGDAVEFTDRSGKRVTGTVRRVNQRTYTVAVDDGKTVYRVPITYPLITAPGEALPEPQADSPWRAGVAVEFTDPTGKLQRGHVTRANPKTLTIRTEDGLQWRVGYGYPHLRRLSA